MGFFQSRSFSSWTFTVFLVVIVWPVLYCLMTVVLYPPDMAEGEYHGQAFEGNRRWFLGIFVASLVADAGLTALRGDLFDPPAYLPVVAHLAVLALLGVVLRSRRYQVILAVYVFLFALCWSLVVRRFLA